MSADHESTPGSIPALLEELQRRGVRVGVEGGELVIQARRGTLGADLKAAVTAHKADLIQLLMDQQEQAAVGHVKLVPLSSSQLRLYFLNRLEPGNPAYNIACGIRLQGTLEPDALRSALSRIVARHEALRSTFRWQDGGPVQVIREAVSLPLVIRDVADSKAAERLALQDAMQPFELDGGDLIRADLFRIAGRNTEHMLVLVVHHSIADAWSTGIVAQELTQDYDACLRGAASSVPPPAMQYADYVLWEQRHQASAQVAAATEYWEQRLAGAPDVLQLPLDRVRPSRFGYRGATLACALSTDLVDRIAALSRDHAATPFMVFLTAFQLLLHRFSLQEDLLIGYPVAGRRSQALEGVVGCLVNTLIHRGITREESSFRDLLTATREGVLEAMTHQDLPFEKLVEQRKIRRDLTRPPLVQVMLVVQNAPAEGPALRGLKVEVIPLLTPTAKFDLTLTITPAPEGAHASLEYAADLFEPETARLLLDAYVHLLKAVTADPDQSAGTIPLTALEEPAVGAEETGETHGATLLHELVEAQVVLRPDAVAVTGSDGALTYGELDALARRVAAALQRRCGGCRAPIGLYMERSAPLVAVALGILKFGAAYLPLDARMPVERLRAMLEDAGPALVVTEESLKANLPAGWAAVSLSDLLQDGAEFGNDAAESRRVTGADPAYIIYTSGSTGIPNGVAISHSSVCHLFQASQLDFEFGPEDVWSLFHSLSFDFSVWEIWGALVHGGRLWIVSHDLARSPREFYRCLVEQGVTVLNLTPSAFEPFSREAITSARDHRLRWLILSGEGLDVGRLSEWMERFGEDQPRVVNSFGITETTVMMTFRVIRSQDLAGAVRSPIGRPFAGITITLVDPAGKSVPPGFPGEIVVGGPGVGPGYLDRPGLTRSRFRPHGTGWRYHSGDLARRLPDGDMDYLGRRDAQVKIRGFRIELGEVEAALRGLDEVADAVVRLHDDPVRGRVLAAYVVLVAGAELPELRHMRTVLGRRLLSPMLPASLQAVAAIPLTPNGKVDRQALPLPDPPGTPTRPVVAPSGTLEEQIAAVFRDLLSSRPVDVEENFFDLGVHSLMLVEAHHRLEAVLNRSIDLVDLFEHPTVRLLARHLESGASGVVARSESASSRPDARENGVAIIGMALRFPGAAHVEEFWENLCQGRESISHFTEEELLGAGVAPALLRHPNYVRASGHLEGVEFFDAEFFGYAPREAELLDPQHRLFLECAWHAMEDAGHVPGNGDSRVGVFAGSGLSRYLLFHLLPHLNANRPAEAFQALLANDKDFLASRVSYKLGLVGPSMSVQTACSSSLVSVHLARNSILAGECDVAIAGGVSLEIEKAGYLYEEGSIAAQDGHCRAFDKNATGTVGGSGVGVVVLKRLDAALRDGDAIRAVIRGSAVNNDGAGKVGYLAPGVNGQVAVMRAALADGGVDPDTIGYVETHGTGTPLGDPIEIQALKRAYVVPDPAPARCGIGSVKTNIGHLDAAAGIAGLIKAALVVERGLLPPSLHFVTPNPRIDFSKSAFFVNTRLTEWQPRSGLRRSGVSSFGMGGTNAHMILEEPPLAARPVMAQEVPELLVFSARTPAALERLFVDLSRHLLKVSTVMLREVAHTLSAGRRWFGCRAFLVAGSVADAAAVLADPHHPRIIRDGLPFSGADERVQTGLRWLAGEPVKGLLSPGPVPRRIPLPGYPFERRRFLIPKPAPLTTVPREPEPSKWLYRQSFKSLPSLVWDQEQFRQSAKNWLIFALTRDAAHPLSRALTALGQRVYTVLPGTEFQVLGEGIAAVRPGHAEDLAALLKHTKGVMETLHHVVHMWTVSPEGASSGEMQLGYFSLLALVQALPPGPVSIGVVSRGIHRVHSGDVIVPERATVLGLCRTIPLEYQHRECRSIDVAGQADADPLDLIVHLSAPGGGGIAALRSGTRFVPFWDRQQPNPAVRSGGIRRGGTYIITGGTGGIGRALALHLVSDHGARVIAVSRSGRAPVGEPTHESERSGLEWRCADVGDPAAMQAVFRQVKAAYGEIHGVFHAAGEPSGELMALQSRQSSHSLFRSKIQGTQVLADLVREFSPEFLVLFSALSASMGFVGQSAYAAANNYLDAFAQAHPTLGRTRVLSLASGAWRETGMAFRATHTGRPPSRASLSAAMLAQGLATAEGVEGVALALTNPEPLIAVSPQDPGLLADAFGAIGSDATGATRRGERHARPELGVPYEVPATEAEAMVADVWSECLGLDRVGRRDNFFDLGGDSLSILEIKTRLESRLGRPLDLSLFVGSSSVAELSALLSRPPVAADGLESWRPAPGEACVLLREGERDVPPLFCVHPVSGTVYPYSSLASCLRRGRRVYGVQSHGLAQGGVVHPTVAGMAAEYVDELVQFQPEGPVLLLGWSFGAVVALEMAQMLRIRGRVVQRLILLDYAAPDSAPDVITADLEIRMKERFDADLNALAPHGAGNITAEFRSRLERVFRAHVTAATRYRPCAYGGDLSVVIARDGLFASHPEPDLGWGRIQPRCQVVKVPGDHYSLLTAPIVNQLALIIDELLG